MRGKSRGLVDVCISWRPKSVGTVLAGEAFAADGAYRHELLQGGIHAWQQLWAMVRGLKQSRSNPGQTNCPCSKGYGCLQN
jgi:hypothetical protein